MRDPKEIFAMIKGATYSVPAYTVTDNGLEYVGDKLIIFCKGNKEDSTVYRQTGFITETVLVAVRQYLIDVNTGATSYQEGREIISKLDEILELIDKRNNDRKNRGVQGTYKP